VSRLPDRLRRETLAVPTTRVSIAPMRAMFLIWAVLIASGIVLYAVIGLTHG
jgi:hypothetical protein